MRIQQPSLNYSTALSHFLSGFRLNVLRYLNHFQLDSFFFSHTGSAPHRKEDLIGTISAIAHLATPGIILNPSIAFHRGGHETEHCNTLAVKVYCLDP